MQQLQKIVRDNQILPTGVIHVGSCEDEEIRAYSDLGFKYLVIIEPHPQKAKKLSSTVHDRHKISIVIVHAAISDRNAQVDYTFYSDGSYDSIIEIEESKLTELGLKKLGHTQIPCYTLDTLLKQLGVHRSQFSYLHLGSRGTEHLALSGAKELLGLPSLSAVYCTVSNNPIYIEQPAVTNFEGFFRDAGFNRCTQLKMNEIFEQGALYLRKPVITMGSLGSAGGFGNCLFQYLYLRIVAHRQKAIAQTIPWIGCKLFNLSDPEPIIFTSILIEENSNLKVTNFPIKGILKHPEKYIQYQNLSILNHDITGYFQLHTSAYKKYRPLIKDIFQFNPEITNLFQPILSQMLDCSKVLVALHIRRGDFGYGAFYRTPCAWFENWLKVAQLQPENCFIYICSDEPQTYLHRFSNYKVYCHLDFNLPPNLAAFLDFYILTRAHHVAISACSSFSLFACMLNEVATDFYRSDIKTESIIKFNPWNCHNIEGDQIISPQEHQRLAKLD